MPFVDERRRNEADRGGIETIQKDDHEAHHEDEPLKRRERMLVDERLYVHGRTSTHFIPFSMMGARLARPHPGTETASRRRFCRCRASRRPGRRMEIGANVR
jgi:hypothetical protein